MLGRDLPGSSSLSASHVRTRTQICTRICEYVRQCTTICTTIQQYVPYCSKCSAKYFRLTFYQWQMLRSTAVTILFCFSKIQLSPLITNISLNPLWKVQTLRFTQKNKIKLWGFTCQNHNFITRHTVDRRMLVEVNYIRFQLTTQKMHLTRKWMKSGKRRI